MLQQANDYRGGQFTSLVRVKSKKQLKENK